MGCVKTLLREIFGEKQKGGINEDMQRVQQIKKRGRVVLDNPAGS